MKNLAADPAFAEIKARLSQRLIKILTDAKDPRVVEQPPRFEQPPFTDVDAGSAAKEKKNGVKIE